MERVAGWHKRKTQIVLFVIGLGIAISLSVDSIMIGRSLWANPARRAPMLWPPRRNMPRQIPTRVQSQVLMRSTPWMCCSRTRCLLAGPLDHQARGNK